MVYADREHFANMAYLTGFDPRFEEALLILTQDHQRCWLVMKTWLILPSVPLIAAVLSKRSAC
jgi:hypothetical protein